jgi:tRNA nucleotidyltransferase (CCA-adding enzyme)
VGRDFPVFLHPHSKEEYALARRERKTGPGYTGFVTETPVDVTLEEDLLRRDLTINAMAKNTNGELIDPHGGAADLKQRVLRHVSPAFIEDPLRVLRVARFAARFKPQGFSVAPETLQLMKQIVESGETDALVAERTWQETQQALAGPAPAEFLSVLRQCGALARVFPEIDALFGVPQPAAYHPEGDAGCHTLLVLESAARLSSDTRVRFAALVHDLGKGTTPAEAWPRHIAHEQRGVDLVKALCDRLRVPQDHRTVAIAVTGQHLLMHRLQELRPETVLKLLRKLDVLRNPARLAPFVLACQADAHGRGTAPSEPYPVGKLLKQYCEAARSIDLTDLAGSPLTDKARGKEADQRRLTAIRAVRKAWANGNRA